MLKIDLKQGESLTIGDVAVITLESKSGKIARLSVDADKAVQVVRSRAEHPANARDAIEAIVFSG